ncbi:hypothetical protein ACWDUL_16725 [Nocardia niigatensis]
MVGVLQQVLGAADAGAEEPLEWGGAELVAEAVQLDAMRVPRSATARGAASDGGPGILRATGNYHGVGGHEGLEPESRSHDEGPGIDLGGQTPSRKP